MILFTQAQMVTFAAEEEENLPGLVDVDVSSKEFQLALKLTNQTKETIVEAFRGIPVFDVFVVDDSFATLLLQASGHED